MASLDDLPTITPSLVGAPPGEDRGPDWIDSETVAELGNQLESGIVVLHPQTGAIVEAAEQADLEQLFADHLAASPLATGYALTHRVYALVMSLRSLTEAKLKGTRPDGAKIPFDHRGVQLATSGLELWLAQTADTLTEVPAEHRGWLAAEASFVDTDTLARLTGMSVAALAQWRGDAAGPPWTVMPGTRRTIRYPVAGVLAWLYGKAPVVQVSAEEGEN